VAQFLSTVRFQLKPIQINKERRPFGRLSVEEMGVLPKRPFCAMLCAQLLR